MNKDKKIAVIISSLMFVSGTACGTIITGIGHTADNSVTVSADANVLSAESKASTKSKVIELPPIGFTRKSASSTSSPVSVSAPRTTSPPVLTSVQKTTSPPVLTSISKNTSAPVTSTSKQLKISYDVNGDGKTNIMDMMYLKQYILKAGK